MELLKDNITLIKVIAEMHDTIQDWRDGWGLPPDTADTLNVVGSLCLSYCVKNNLTELPEVELPSED